MIAVNMIKNLEVEIYIMSFVHLGKTEHFMLVCPRSCFVAFETYCINFNNNATITTAVVAFITISVYCVTGIFSILSYLGHIPLLFASVYPSTPQFQCF